MQNNIGKSILAGSNKHLTLSAEDFLINKLKDSKEAKKFLKNALEDFCEDGDAFALQSALDFLAKVSSQERATLKNLGYKLTISQSHNLHA